LVEILRFEQGDIVIVVWYEVEVESKSASLKSKGAAPGSIYMGEVGAETVAVVPSLPRDGTLPPRDNALSCRARNIEERGIADTHITMEPSKCIFHNDCPQLDGASSSVHSLKYRNNLDRSRCSVSSINRCLLE
jgi:hypothetical protein